MNAKKITIQILGWNSVHDLQANLQAVAALQDSAVIRFIDNASTDGSAAYVQQHFPCIEVVHLPANIGYASGNNIGFALCTTPLVLTLNPDVEIHAGGITELVHKMEHDDTVGAIQGLLMRPGSAGLVDSAGIMRTYTLNGVDRGAGTADKDAFTQPASIDAVTGACGLFRMAALKSIAHQEYTVAGKEVMEIFDKDFFAYKEDVDLGWRLQRAKWRVRFEPVFTGYHRRALQSQGIAGWGMQLSAIVTRLGSRRTQMSLRNYIWLVVKNASAKEILIHEIFIDMRLLLFFALSLLYWPLFPVWREALRGLPNMLHKRSYEAINHHS